MRTFTFTSEEVLALEASVLEAQKTRLRLLVDKGIGYDEAEYSALSVCLGKFGRDDKEAE
jgi:hypothetical protein